MDLIKKLRIKKIKIQMAKMKYKKKMVKLTIFTQRVKVKQI